MTQIILHYLHLQQMINSRRILTFPRLFYTEKSLKLKITWQLRIQKSSKILLKIKGVRLKGEHISKNCTSEIQCYKYSKRRLLEKPGFGPSTRMLKKLELGKAGALKTQTLKNMDPGKHACNKYGIKKCSSLQRFRFIKTMPNVICCFRVKIVITTQL